MCLHIIHMRRCKISPTPCIWANSEFLVTSVSIFLIYTATCFIIYGVFAVYFTLCSLNSRIGGDMELIGYVIIVISIFGAVINGRSFMFMYKIKKGASAELNTSESKQLDSWFSSFAAYELGGLVFSLGALLIGFYIAVNGTSLVQLVGFVFLLLSLVGFVQSLGSQTALGLRIIALIELCIAVYLLA